MMKSPVKNEKDQEFFLILLMVAIAVIIIGCEPLEPTVKPVDENEVQAGVPAPQLDEAVPLGTEVLHEMTADYERLPVDVMIYVDKQSLNTEMIERLAAVKNATIARLRLSDRDIHILGVEVSSDANNQGRVMTLVQELAPFVDKRSANLLEKFSTLFSAPIATQTIFNNESLLEEVFSHATNSSDLNPIRRNGSFLSLIVISALGEPTESQTIDTKALSALYPKGWSLSFLGPKFMDFSANNCINQEPTPFWDKTVRDSNGIRASLCDESYLSFFNYALTDGSGSSEFKLVVPKDLISTDIMIMQGSRTETTWSYDSTLGELILPQTIAPGAKLSVVKRQADRQILVVKPREKLEERGPPPALNQDPKQKEFFEQINPILAQNCSGGGCHGVGTALQEYVGNFDKVTRSRGSILNRISRAEGAPGRMPPNGLDAAALASLSSYLNSF
jgi:hypothetical protein